ncbi:MAG: acetyl-CoA carboxylase carboxyltransferase subunit alpha [Endomicrobium sp.]|jgi:acetyl-CoA carboxylase carboxyl transferase subunit alpha|nr:acetyl-CoA carboxylase carboxyltransferase subunit alpha [Endomicrobium sp.]
MEITFDFESPIVDMDKKIEELKKSAQNGGLDLSDQIKDLEKTKNDLKQKIYSSLSAWQKVQIARHPQRPYFSDYVNLIFEDFVELSGDRAFGNDQAILCGIASINGKTVVAIGHQKGRTLEENMDRNFGMAHPEGYRKAMRIMRMAEKFNRSIITFIDTAGAYPGIAAEERGQAEAIARNLRDMSDLKVPIISVVIGEGGSGGALGIGVSNIVLCLENAYYSVISPEGCAAILLRDGSKASQAASAMKLTAKDLLNLKVIDEIIKEPLGGAHYDYEKTALNIKASLSKYLLTYENMPSKKIVEERYLKFRNMGVYEDKSKKIIKSKCSKKVKIL